MWVDVSGPRGYTEEKAHALTVWGTAEEPAQ